MNEKMLRDKVAYLESRLTYWRDRNKPHVDQESPWELVTWTPSEGWRGVCGGAMFELRGPPPEVVVARRIK